MLLEYWTPKKLLLHHPAFLKPNLDSHDTWCRTNKLRGMFSDACYSPVLYTPWLAMRSRLSNADNLLFWTANAIRDYVEARAPFSWQCVSLSNCPQILMIPWKLTDPIWVSKSIAHVCFIQSKLNVSFHSTPISLNCENSKWYDRYNLALLNNLLTKHYSKFSFSYLEITRSWTNYKLTTMAIL